MSDAEQKPVPVASTEPASTQEEAAAKSNAPDVDTTNVTIDTVTTAATSNTSAAPEASEVSKAPEVPTSTEPPAPASIESKEPAAVEAKEPAVDAKEPVAVETKEPATTEAKEPAAAEAKEPAAVEAKEPAAVEAKEPAAAETKEPAAAEASPVSQLWTIAKANGHPEIWGVTLADPETHVPTHIILQKYLNANDGDLSKAKDQLTKTLEWRAKTKPLELAKKVFSKAKFDGLGYVTKYLQDGSAEPEGKEVFTWNIYGGVKSMDETFGKIEEFLEWRVALMELALQELDISSATKQVTADYDPYKIFQVHDYKSISFLRQSPQVKSASAETIKVFAQNYPELLKEKFFVNVPAIMGFVYAFMKLFVAPKTIKKFHPMSNGGNLAVEFAESKVTGLGERLPPNYGGKGVELEQQGKGPLLE